MIGTLNINGVNLEIDKRVIVPLNYAIADARNPQKRKRNTSEVIALKGTKTNKDFFFSAWNLGASDEKQDGIGFNFDPTIKYPAYYLEKGQIVFRGSASLDSITIDKGNYTFNVILYSNVVDVFQILGDTKLPELGWEDYNETLSVANIQASWSNPIGSGILYPLVDYGFTNNLLEYYTNEIFPHVYWKEVFEKAFALADLTIDSDFFDTDLFKSLIIGTGGGEKATLSAGDVADRRVNYTGDGTTTRSIASSATANSYPSGFRRFFSFNESFKVGDNSITTTTLVNDTNSQFDESLGRVSIQNTGYYNLEVQGIFPLTYGFVGGTITNEDILIQFIFYVKRNGAIVFTRERNIFDTTLGGGGLDDLILTSTQNALFLEAGDVLDFEIECKITKADADAATIANLPTSFDYSLDLNNTFEFDLTYTNFLIIDGNTVEVASYLPDIKVSDFLNGVIKAFNLYVGEPNERGVVKIEPLEDFYEDTSEAKVMSEKVDYSKPMKIEPASGIEGKRYLFRFAEDLDHYKQLYFEQYGVHYGDHIYEVPSTFKKGDKVYQLPFAQSVPVEIAGTELIIPRIISYDPINQVSEPYKGKARVYYYQGLKTMSTDTWDLVNSATDVATNLTQYPAVGHLDDRTSPTFDLNFRRPEIVYYTATAYTSNNLFSGYHEQFLRELTGRDSKFLQLYMKLTPDDLQGEFLRTLWNIKGTIYRINQIREYNANGDNTTWCELVRINRGNSPKIFTSTTSDVPLRSTVFNSQYEKTIRDFGNDNTISGTSKSILIQGDGNTINDGIDNVTLLQVDNYTPPISDVVVIGEAGDTVAIGGIVITGDDIVKEISASSVNANVNTQTYLADTSSNDIRLILPASPPKGKFWNVKKLYKAGKVRLDPGALTIDGEDEIFIKNKDTSVTVQFDGTNYIII